LQVCVFNKNGSLVAAQWISGAWVIVGTVTSTGDGGHINDVWYDHIMPVEIEGPTGVRNLRLGHNNGENPFTAAQRFIDQNELQQSYLGQIADWITARAGQTMPTIGTGASGVVGNPGTAHVKSWFILRYFASVGFLCELCCAQSGVC
jgi:phospholipase A-2-activating protein